MYLRISMVSVSNLVAECATIGEFIHQLYLSWEGVAAIKDPLLIDLRAKA